MKIEVRLRKIGNAGMYELMSKTNGITPDMILKLCNGEPYYNAKLEAEKLAVILNCELWEDDILIKEAINREIKFSSEVEEQQKNLDQIDLWAMEIQSLIKKVRGKI